MGEGAGAQIDGSPHGQRAKVLSPEVLRCIIDLISEAHRTPPCPGIALSALNDSARAPLPPQVNIQLHNAHKSDILGVAWQIKRQNNACYGRLGSPLLMQTKVTPVAG